jgi:hypothetical protein
MRTETFGNGSGVADLDTFDGERVHQHRESIGARSVTDMLGESIPVDEGADDAENNTIEDALEGGHDLDVRVDEVEAAATALDPTAKPTKSEDLDAELGSAGLSPEQIAKVKAIVGTKPAAKSKQRRLSTSSIVTSAALITHFAGRSDAQIELDAVKGIRDDGGPLGAVGVYEKIIFDHGIDAETAKTVATVIAAKVNHRVKAIRSSVVATINELRRRAAGPNAATAKYIRVSD